MAQTRIAPRYEQLSRLFHHDTSTARFERNSELARRRLEADSTFRTGLMTSSGELFLAVPRELSLLTEKILGLERRVSQAYRELPPIAFDATIADLIADEVVSSNALEHVSSTKHEVLRALSTHGNRGGPRHRRRFGEFARLYQTLLEGRTRPATPEDIRTVYDTVMEGEALGDDAPDGRIFRARDVDIIGYGGRAIHKGVSGEAAIAQGIQDMIALVDDERIPKLYSAIMGHFYFEYLHPFYDGNGRCGRYLLALYLSSPLSILTSLSLSRMISEHRDAYYRSFRDAENPLNHGELTFFVLNLLEDIREAQSRLLERHRWATNAVDTMVERVRAIVVNRILSESEGEILFGLAQWCLFGDNFPQTWDDITRYLKVSKSTSRRLLTALEDRGLVVVTSRRPLAFAISNAGLHLIGADEASSIGGHR